MGTGDKIIRCRLSFVHFLRSPVADGCLYALQGLRITKQSSSSSQSSNHCRACCKSRENKCWTLSRSDGPPWQQENLITNRPAKTIRNGTVGEYDCSSQHSGVSLKRSSDLTMKREIGAQDADFAKFVHGASLFPPKRCVTLIVWAVNRDQNAGSRS